MIELEMTDQGSSASVARCLVTTMTTGHGDIKSYLHRFKIIESSTCPCGTTEQNIDHLIFQCELLGKERDKLISGVSKTDNWPLSKNRLISEHFKSFSKFIHEISLEKLNEM